MWGAYINSEKSNTDNIYPKTHYQQHKDLIHSLIIHKIYENIKANTHPKVCTATKPSLTIDFLIYCPYFCRHMTIARYWLVTIFNLYPFVWTHPCICKWSRWWWRWFHFLPLITHRAGMKQKAMRISSTRESLIVQTMIVFYFEDEGKAIVFKCLSLVMWLFY